MLPRGRGHIVNVASTAGKAGIAGSATYCAAKAAVVQYTEGAYAELHPQGLEFSIVMPGITRTELTAGVEDMPAFRAITPESVADAIVAAIVKPRLEVYVPRSAGTVIGLTRLLPFSAGQWIGKRMGADHVFMDAIERPERSGLRIAREGDLLMKRPTLLHFPGDGLLDKAESRIGVKALPLALPPAGSGLKPVMGERGLPGIGKSLEFIREGESAGIRMAQKHGGIYWNRSFGTSIVWVVGPEAIQEVAQNKGKIYSQDGWVYFIGPFFNRGLMLLDGQEHLLHRRIMQEAFTRPRLESYQGQVQDIISRTVPTWPTDAPMPMYPAVKQLSLDVATEIFMGAEPSRETHALTQAFIDTVRAGTGLIRRPVPLLKTRWNKGSGRPEAARCVLPPADPRQASVGRRRSVRSAVPCRDRRRSQVHRRRHRQSHDLPDDGGPRHVDDHVHRDGLLPRQAPRVAGQGTCRVARAQRRPADHRRAGLPDHSRPRFQRGTPAGGSRPDARPPGHRGHRTTGALHPQGHDGRPRSRVQPTDWATTGSTSTSSTRSAMPSRATSTRCTASATCPSAAEPTSASAWRSARTRSRRSCTRCSRRTRSRFPMTMRSSGTTPRSSSRPTTSL